MEEETAVEDVSASQRRVRGVPQGHSVHRGLRDLQGDQGTKASRATRDRKVTVDEVA